MEQKNEIRDELQQIGPLLAGAGKVHPFIVPSGYFDKLAMSIVARIALAQTEVEEELAEIAPLLRSIHKKEVYAAPQGYFDVLRSIPEASKTEPAKVIVLKKYRRWIQYAAAAMLGGLLVSGAFMFTDSKNYIRTSKPAAQVSRQENVTGNSSNPASTEEVVSAVTEEGIPGKQPAASEQKMHFSKKIELLSDDELQNYLEENAPSEPIQLIEDSLEDTTTI